MNNSSGKQTSMIIDQDAWIICNSRSHPGLKFYVNKVTGVKVWNITASEIALAEKFGKVGPEPAGPPTMNSPTDKTAKIFNKQIINNQFSNQLSNLLLTPQPGNPIAVWNNHHSQPINLQQQLYTIVPAALLNPAASLQNYQQLLAQSTSLHNNASFLPQQNVQNRRTPSKKCHSSIKPFKFRKNLWNNEQHQRTESTFNHTNDTDLRRKLRRRSFSRSLDNNEINLRNEKKTRKETYNRIEQGLEEVSVQIDLAPLKTLTALNTESNQWFIVVEKDIILENFNYLNNIVAADPDCHLVVPHHVMSELRTHVSVSSDVRPRRTLRFLTQQIENGMATLGEQEAGQGSSHNTILTCVKLALRNNVVILIASNKETLTFKPNINGIHVFSMQAVKDILDNKSTKPRVTSPTMAIKIVVPNDLKEKGTHEPEENISRDLYNGYGYYQSSSNNEKNNILPPPATKMVSPIIDNVPKQPMEPVSVTITPKPVIQNVLLEIHEKNQSKQENNTSTNSKIEYNNPHKPAMTNISPGHSTQNTQENNYLRCSQIYDSNPHIQACNAEAPQKSHETTTITIPSNNNVEVKEDELSRRGSATYIAATDPNNSNFHYSSAIKPSDSNTEANKISPKKPEFASPRTYQNSPKKPEFTSPRKVYNSNWHQTGTKNMHDTMDTSSNSSTSIVSLDSIGIKKIISMKKLTTARTSKELKDNAKEINIMRPKSISSWTSYDNDNTSEPSLKRNASKNFVIEESSTSGIISNSESSYSDVINPKKQDVRKVTRRRNVVMYEVACQSMEEVLKMRSEEWVFRFVQIMEEVLRVKLQEKIPYEQKEPAPWNLQEAARCIIKKFDNHFDVVDAANKLSRFLYETSDENGKIMNIEPSDYMELYSYGVFLVETFLDMCADCKEEDCRMKTNEKRGSFIEEKCSCHEVVTASELLKKLLFDIHNANIETFVDHPSDFTLDQSVDDCVHHDFNIKTTRQSSPEDAETLMDKMECAENVKHNSKKRKRTDALDEVSRNVKKLASMNSVELTKKVENNDPCQNSNLDKAVDDVSCKVKRKGKRFEKVFFNSLQLTKVDNGKKFKVAQKADLVPSKVPTISTSSDSAFFSSQLDKSKSFKDLKNVDKRKASKITVVCSNKADAPDERKDRPRSSREDLLGLKCHFSSEDNLLEKSPSKVVCNFKINEDLERRVRAKWLQKEYEDSEENMAEEYNETPDYTPLVNKSTLRTRSMTANETLCELTRNGNQLLKEKEVHEINKITEDEATAKFERLIMRLSQGLGNVFTRIISLCYTYSKERIKMRSEKCIPEELHRKVEFAYLLLSRIHKYLESIKNRKHQDEFSYLQMLLKLENTGDNFPDDRFCMQYRHGIAIFAKTAEDILKGVRGILNVGQEGRTDDIATSITW